MEIQEDKLQQRILRLRKKQNTVKKSPSKSGIGGVDGSNELQHDTAYSFLSPLTCTKNSKRYLKTDKKGRPIDDDDMTHSMSRTTLGRQSGFKNHGD